MVSDTRYANRSEFDFWNVHPQNRARYYADFRQAAWDLDRWLGIHVAADSFGWSYVDDVGQVALPGRWRRST